jgi:hypothetical protein
MASKKKGKKAQSEEEETSSSSEEQEETKNKSEAESEEETSEEEGEGKIAIRSSKSVISQGKVEATATKKYFNSKKLITAKVWINDQHYRPGATIVLNVDIKNESDAQIKSIQAVLKTIEVVTEGKKKKKKKPVQSGKHEEWFQGARFPLDGYTDYDGSVNYSLPSALPDSSDTVIHELELPTAEAFIIDSCISDAWSSAGATVGSFLLLGSQRASWMRS